LSSKNSSKHVFSFLFWATDQPFWIDLIVWRFWRENRKLKSVISSVLLFFSSSPLVLRVWVTHRVVCPCFFLHAFLLFSFFKEKFGATFLKLFWIFSWNVEIAAMKIDLDIFKHLLIWNFSLGFPKWPWIRSLFIIIIINSDSDQYHEENIFGNYDVEHLEIRKVNPISCLQKILFLLFFHACLLFQDDWLFSLRWKYEKHLNNFFFHFHHNIFFMFHWIEFHFSQDFLCSHFFPFF